MYGNHDGSCALMTILLSSCLDCNVMFAEGGEGGREDINRREGRGCCIVFRANKQTNKQMSTTTFEKRGRVYVTYFCFVFATNLFCWLV